MQFSVFCGCYALFTPRPKAKMSTLVLVNAKMLLSLGERRQKVQFDLARHCCTISHKAFTTKINQSEQGIGRTFGNNYSSSVAYNYTHEVFRILWIFCLDFPAI